MTSRPSRIGARRCAVVMAGSAVVVWSTSCATDPAESAAGDRVAAVRVTAVEPPDEAPSMSTTPSTASSPSSSSLTVSSSSSTSSSSSSSSSRSSSSSGERRARAVVGVDGGTFVLEARDGALELVEHDVTDGWVVDVVSEAPDELRLVLTPAPNASGASTRAVHDTTTTVVVRLTPTGIETYTESRATSGEG